MKILFLFYLMNHRMKFSLMYFSRSQNKVTVHQCSGLTGNVSVD